MIDDTTAAIATGVSATTHGDPGGDIGATLNLPVIEGRMALRIVGYAVTEGGYIDNPTLGQSDVNRTSIAGGRVRCASSWGATGRSIWAACTSGPAATTASIPIATRRPGRGTVPSCKASVRITGWAIWSCRARLAA
ncbi:hypothetical protein [Sphingomonas aerolata]|uniref:hypothetical protein n=1 Tax=Sphingomonas aerolata TaxID=185951 RepID=UPI002FE2EE79